MRHLLITALYLFAGVSTLAQDPAEQSNRLQVLHVRSTPDFDITGEGTNEAWKTAEWTTLPLRNNPKSDYRAEMKILYSAKGIYCLYSCSDRKITATLTEDFDDIYKEDVVEAFFWPDETIPLYFEYEISPLNAELPIIIPNLNNHIMGWRPWHYEGERRTRHAIHLQKTDKGIFGWSAEFFIPFALLHPLTNNPPQKGTRWRANFYRIDYDEGTSYFMWQPTNNNFHEFKKFGTIQFD